MDAMEAILTRRSIRKYRPEVVPTELIDQLLAAGMSAPSAQHKNPWQFVVITDRKVMDEIPKFHPYSNMLKEAPLAFCVCGDIAIAPQYWVQDCSAVAENILIAARALGLGGVWLGVYPIPERVSGLRNLLKLPENIMPLGLLSIGYPAEEKPRSAGLEPARVHYNSW
jgi:nitroreductase